MSGQAGPDPDRVAALRARFEQQSRTARAYYTAMHAAQAALGSMEAASAWMETPLAAAEGRTPAQLVKQGRQDEVLALIRALAR